jgi:hypothetical protein
LSEKENEIAPYNKKNNETMSANQKGYGNRFCAKIASYITIDQLTRIVLRLGLLEGALEQWPPTGGTRTPRSTRRHLRGYVKFKISIYILFHE